ncbi:hypothetical protein Tco_0637755 [Tanacetum coccineum]
MEKPQEEEPGKTNVEAEVQSIVSVPIHQDTSSVPLMTTLVIDLMKSQSDSLLPTSTITTSTIITTTNLPPPPLQSTTDLILACRIGKLEQHIADLIQNNLALEERLDKHGSRLYKLKNLNIPHQVSKAVDEIVTDAVDWAMQALFRASFRDLPTIDMKEILQQRMYEDNTYKTHEVHNDLYESLKKLVELDYSNQCLADQEEARKKKRKRRESPRTPLGSPPIQPPHLLQQAHSVPPNFLSIKNPLSCPPPTITPFWGHLTATSGICTQQADIPRHKSLSLTDYLCRMIPFHPGRQAYEVVKAFYPISFTFSSRWKSVTIENPEGDHVKIDVNRPLPLGGPPVQNMASLTGALNGHNSIIDRHDHRRVENMSRTQCGFSVSSELKSTQDTDAQLESYFPVPDKRMLSTAVKQWTQNLVLRQQVEDFQTGIESY